MKRKVHLRNYCVICVLGEGRNCAIQKQKNIPSLRKATEIFNLEWDSGKWDAVQIERLYRNGDFEILTEYSRWYYCDGERFPCVDNTKNNRLT